MQSVHSQLFLLLCSALILLSACQQEEPVPEAAASKTGVVEASAAYLDSFGTPPQGKEGRAYARVGYLPLQDGSGKLRAFPLFLFSEQDQLQKLLDKLISGDFVANVNSPVSLPFPDDLVCTVNPVQDQALILSLKTSLSWPEQDQVAAGRALSETALQLDNISRVHILLNDRPLSVMPEDGYRHDPALLAPIPPPSLIMMAGTWEKGRDDPVELLAEFDRPIRVNSIELSRQDGSMVEGDYYTSIFQMAVVVHPVNPALYREGTPIMVEWDVVDDLGRSNRGVDTLPLVKLTH